MSGFREWGGGALRVVLPFNVTQDSLSIVGGWDSILADGSRQKAVFS